MDWSHDWSGVWWSSICDRAHPPASRVALAVHRNGARRLDMPPRLLASPREEADLKTRYTRDVAAFTTLRVARGLGCRPQRGAGQRPASTRLHASYPHPHALTLRIRFKLTASPIVSSSTETRCRRRPCQLNTVVAFAAASFIFLYRTCGAGLRRRQFFKLEHHLRLHALVWGRVSGYVLAFSLCLGEKETDSPFFKLHISRDRVPCESRERHRDRGARACRTGRVSV